MDILPSVGNELHCIMSGQSVLGDCPLSVSSVISSRDDLLLPWIDAAPYGVSSAPPAFDLMHAASSSLSKKNSNTPPEHWAKRWKTSPFRTRVDAAKASSDYTPALDLESDGE